PTISEALPSPRDLSPSSPTTPKSRWTTLWSTDTWKSPSSAASEWCPANMIVSRFCVIPGTKPRIPTRRKTAPKMPATIWTRVRVGAEGEVCVIMTVLSTLCASYACHSVPKRRRMGERTGIHRIFSPRRLPRDHPSQGLSRLTPRASLLAMRSIMAVLWRRLLVLLIGGVVPRPDSPRVIWVGTAWNAPVDRAAALGVVAIGIVTFALLCVPAFLTVIRALERTLAVQLLGLNIAVPARQPTSADRVRGALFYFGHVFAGALLLITVIVLLPTAELLAVEPSRVVELSGGFIGAETDLGVDATTENGVPAVRDAPAILLPADLIQIVAPFTVLLLVAVIIAEGYFL